MKEITAEKLSGALRDLAGEPALLDVREEGAYARGHILLATSLPLSRLELNILRLVPRRRTPIILCDDDDGLAETAAVRLAALGYTDIAVLSGGIGAWSEAGCEIFSGLNVPAKALGIFAQRALQIPEMWPRELAVMMESGAPVAIVDCRPEAEYRRGTIPAAKNAPGVELLRRIGGLSPKAQVVVTCAGRTRGLIGAQMLREAGFAGTVHALCGGTMGWELDGRPLEKGASRRLGGESPRGGANETHRRFASQGNVTVLDHDALGGWLSDDSRTTYLFDIRERDEYEAGHITGARQVPGGQLLQALDQHAAVQGARIVLIDDDGARAAVTALWLLRLGWREVAVASVHGTRNLVTGGDDPPSVPLPRNTRFVKAEALRRLLKEEEVLLVDLGTSRAYRTGHIAGAWFAIRSRLERTLYRLPKAKKLVLTSEDGRLAAYAAADDLEFDGEIFALEGGNAAWKEAGYPLSKTGERFADTSDDLVLKPSELTDGRERAMRDYLAGSGDLLEKVTRDGSLRLNALPLTSLG